MLRLAVLCYNMSRDQIINLVKYCHMIKLNTGYKIALAHKTLLTSIFPINDTLGAINICRECGICPGQDHFAKSREPFLLGKIQVVPAGPPGS